MELARRPSAAAIEEIPINVYMSSTCITELPLDLHPPQLVNELTIPQLFATDRHLNIFGIPVEIEVDEDAIIVTDYIVNMYGVGNSMQEAIEDYKISIKAYFKELEENEEKLANNLMQHLHYLRHIFMPLK